MSRGEKISGLLGFIAGFLEGATVLILIYAGSIKEIPLMFFSGIILAYSFFKVEMEEKK